jgi:hypothetical protein
VESTDSGMTERRMVVGSTLYNSGLNILKQNLRRTSDNAATKRCSGRNENGPAKARIAALFLQSMGGSARLFGLGGHRKMPAYFFGCMAWK